MCDSLAVIRDGHGGYWHKTVCHTCGAYARDEDGDGFCEIHVNTIEGFWSLPRFWLRPRRGISQDKLPLYLGFFQVAWLRDRPVTTPEATMSHLFINVAKISISTAPRACDLQITH